MKEFLKKAWMRAIALLPIMMALQFTACKKAIVEQETLVSVTIYAGDSGPMSTRTSNTSEVNALISAAHPSSVSLSLTNTQTNLGYSAKTGQAVLLPVGTYRVTGRYKPTSAGAYNGSAYVATSPAFNIDAQLVIQASVTEYTVPVVWASFALCCDTEEVTSWSWYPYAGNATEPPAATNGGTSLFFVCGAIERGAMRVALSPADLGHYSATDWYIATAQSELAGFDNALLAVSGRWYRLHPNGVVTESGSIALQFPDWECGGE